MRQLISTSLLSKALLLAALSLDSTWVMAHAPMVAPGYGGRLPGMVMGGGHMVLMLEVAGATEAQHAQIKQIMNAAEADLKPQHEAARKLYEQGMALFTAPMIDDAAIEANRQQALTLHNQIDKRMVQAMSEAAKVLTSEQRAKAAEKMKAMQARRGGRGMDPVPPYKHDGTPASGPLPPAQLCN